MSGLHLSESALGALSEIGQRLSLRASALKAYGIICAVLDVEIQKERYNTIDAM